MFCTDDSHHSLDIMIDKSTNNIESDIILFHDADDALLESELDIPENNKTTPLAVTEPPHDLGLDSPAQPILNFSKTNGNSFNANWYKQYTWLDYSQAKNAAYCFSCRKILYERFYDSV